jgi:uncharacterized protein (DUF1330 family)
MAGYVIGQITIKDLNQWREYRAKVPPTLAKWGGELVLRGRKVAVLNGEHSVADTVVSRFPDADAASGWYASSAYQELIPIREKAAEMVLISYESDR